MHNVDSFDSETWRDVILLKPRYQLEDMYFFVVLCIFCCSMYLFVVLCIFCCSVYFLLFYVFFVFFFVLCIFCVVLCILCCSMYCLFCDVLCIVCVYMCTELLPPGGYPVAVKYIISYIISYAWYIKTELTALYIVEDVPWFQLARRPVARSYVRGRELSDSSSLSSWATGRMSRNILLHGVAW